MPHQQVEFLQLIQRLATHCALSIPIAYHTMFVGVDHGAADRDVKAAHANEPNELVGEGTRHLQTREQSRVVAFAFPVIVPRCWPPPLPPAMPARFRFLIINWPNLSCPGMGSYIATATNDNKDYVDVDVDEVGPKAMQRSSRSHANFSGRYISMHSSTNNVDEENNFLSYP